MGNPPTPPYGQCPKVNNFFLLMSSLRCSIPHLAFGPSIAFIDSTTALHLYKMVIFLLAGALIFSSPCLSLLHQPFSPKTLLDRLSELLFSHPTHMEPAHEKLQKSPELVPHEKLSLTSFVSQSSCGAFAGRIP